MVGTDEGVVIGMNLTRLQAETSASSRVAAGRCDGFWEMDLHPWDTAAGLVILEEAGGRVTDFAGGPFSVYGKQIVASNSKIHEEMVSVLRNLQG